MTYHTRVRPWRRLS